jgi:hypothetical protein
MEFAMAIEEQIRSLLKEAALYDEQGLYEASRERYQQTADLVGRHAHRIHHHKKILKAVAGRLERLHNRMQRMENEPAVYTPPDAVIEVMKRHFCASADREEAALEGAAALAEFGQYDHAVEEFAKLIKTPKTRLEASKHMIRCHLEKGRTAEASALLRHWHNSGLMNRDEWLTLQRYVKELVAEKRLCVEVPPAEMKDEASGPAAGTKHGEIVRRFNSISLKPPNAQRGQGMREFNILSQSADVVRISVAVQETTLADGLTPGTVLNTVLCFFDDGMFSSKATVVGKQWISSDDAGAGHFNIDIQVQGG